VSAQTQALTKQFAASLRAYTTRPLAGLQSPGRLDAFVGQLVESTRRVEFVISLPNGKVSSARIDPSSDAFDPVRAAVWSKLNGNVEDAYWLAFISVHFGKHLRDGWRLARDVYAGDGQPWDWHRTSSDPARFRTWLGDAVQRWNGDGITRRFGNHRKYESRDAKSTGGTGAVVASYVNWVGPSQSHVALVAGHAGKVGNAPSVLFHSLYQSMSAVARFGRTARFDFLTMVGKLGLAAIQPGSTYLAGATGPRRGAKLLFANDANAKLRTPELEQWVIDLALHLDVGMQVMEDTICNWQKSPAQFVRFRG
jgi:hypothetical protein